MDQDDMTKTVLQYISSGTLPELQTSTQTTDHTIIMPVTQPNVELSSPTTELTSLSTVDPSCLHTDPGGSTLSTIDFSCLHTDSPTNTTVDPSLIPGPSGVSHQTDVDHTPDTLYQPGNFRTREHLFFPEDTASVSTKTTESFLKEFKSFVMFDDSEIDLTSVTNVASNTKGCTPGVSVVRLTDSDDEEEDNHLEGDDNADEEMEPTQSGKASTPSGFGSGQRKGYVKPTGIRNRLSKELQGLMGEANLQYAKRNFSEAVKMCMEIVRQVPKAHQPYQLLSIIYEELGDTEKTVQYALLSAYLMRVDRDEWTRAAELCAEYGRCHQAVTCYRKAVGCSSGVSTDLPLLTTCLQLARKEGQHIAALNCFFDILCIITATNNTARFMVLVKEMLDYLDRLFKSGNDLLNMKTWVTLNLTDLLLNNDCLLSAAQQQPEQPLYRTVIDTAVGLLLSCTLETRPFLNTSSKSTTISSNTGSSAASSTLSSANTDSSSGISAVSSAKRPAPLSASSSETSTSSTSISTATGASTKTNKNPSDNAVTLSCLRILHRFQYLVLRFEHDENTGVKSNKTDFTIDKIFYSRLSAGFVFDLLDLLCFGDNSRCSIRLFGELVDHLCHLVMGDINGCIQQMDSSGPMVWRLSRISHCLLQAGSALAADGQKTEEDFPLTKSLLLLLDTLSRRLSDLSSSDLHRPISFTGAIHRLYADCLCQCHLLEQAVEALTRALETEPADTETRIRLASLLQQLTRHQEALDVLSVNSGDGGESVGGLDRSTPMETDASLQQQPTSELLVDYVKKALHKCWLLLAQQRTEEFVDASVSLLHFLCRPFMQRYIAGQFVKVGEMKNARYVSLLWERAGQRIVGNKELSYLDDTTGMAPIPRHVDYNSLYDLIVQLIQTLYPDQPTKLTEVILCALAYQPLHLTTSVHKDGGLEELYGYSMSAALLAGDLPLALLQIRPNILSQAQLHVAGDQDSQGPRNVRWDRPNSTNLYWNLLAQIWRYAKVSADLHRSVLKPLVRQMSKYPSHRLTALCVAHLSLSSGYNYLDAIGEYLNLLRDLETESTVSSFAQLSPDSFTSIGQPVVCLCLSAVYALLVSKKDTKKRHWLVIQALYFLDRYTKLRGNCQESLYNSGRLFQQLGILPAALHYYKLALDKDPPPFGHSHNDSNCTDVDCARSSKIFDLRREIAYNMAAIYRSGRGRTSACWSPQLARHILQTYCTFDH